MIDKVIIAEDQESSNLSVRKIMEELRIADPHHVFYCDDAFNRIRAALQTGHPYDLLITDLSFEADSNSQKIADGFELITSVRRLQPSIAILVFTADSRPATIDKLFGMYEVDAYVRKARNDIRELKSAFDALTKGEKYYPRAAAQLVKHSNTYDFTEFDISIIRLLSQGCDQKHISLHLQKSLSTIEKRLNRIRGELGFSKNEQLVFFCKDTGLI